MSDDVDGTLVLRPMTAADVVEVLSLENELFPHDAWPESFFFDELSHAEPQAGAESATRKYWVVETGAGIIGYAGMMCVLPLADVQTIAVAPVAQGQGVGTRLLRSIVAEATTWGAEQLLLEVRIDNTGAQSLYRREGFVHIHTRRRYYPDGADALIMQKALKDLDAPSSASALRS